MVALVRELRRLCVRVGLVSNSWGNDYPDALLDELFDPIVIAGNVGLRKPWPSIHGMALRRLQPPAEWRRASPNYWPR